MVFLTGDAKVELRVVSVRMVAEVQFSDDFEERTDVDVEEHW